MNYERRVQGTLTNEVSFLFPVGYKQDFRELMAYIDSQFEKLSSENDSTFYLIMNDGGEY